MPKLTSEKSYYNIGDIKENFQIETFVCLWPLMKTHLASRKHRSELLWWSSG